MALPPHLADLEGRLASRVDEALAGFRRAFEARLREATDRLLADAAAIAPPRPAALLGEFEFETEALEEIPRREGARRALAELLEAVRAFDRARTQSEVLSALIAAGRSAADRRALLIVRDDRLILFGSAGYSSAPDSGTEMAFDGPLRERLYAARGCLDLGAEAATEVGAQLGWSAGGPALVVPLVLRDRIAALLWADRQAPAPELAPLQLLTLMAAQRLELQALSARAFTPTLYEGSAAPGAPLPLWSSEPEPAAPPPSFPAEEEAGEPALDAAAAFEIVGADVAPQAAPTATEAESAVAVEPEVGASWSSSAASLESPSPAEPSSEMEAVADELWAGATTAEFDAAQLEAAAESEGAAVEALFAAEAAPPLAPTAPPAVDELAAAESVGAHEIAPAVEPELESVAEVAVEAVSTFEAELEPGIESERAAEAAVELGEEPAFEPTEPELPGPQLEEIDLLATMRLPVLSFPLAGAERVPEETTAPVHVQEVSTSSPGASTHEIPVPEEPPAASPGATLAPSEADFTEDATVLTRRIPPIPQPPAEDVVRGAQPTIPLGPIASTVAPPPALAAAPEAAPFVAPPPAPVAPVEDPMDRTSSRQRSTEVAPPPDLQGPGRAFLGNRVQRAMVDSPTHEEAKRLARLLISEIKLYNEEQVLEGRRNRDLYHRLKEDIDRSRQIYEERIDPGVRSGSDYFHQELVRSLAGGDPRALGI